MDAVHSVGGTALGGGVGSELVAGAEPGRDISNARVTPGVLAGTVTVRCEEQASDSTESR